MKVFQSFRGDKGQKKGEDEEEEEKEEKRAVSHGVAFFIARQEEKRREVVTGNVHGTYTGSEAVAHGRYLEVPTFSRWSFSLYLTLSTHPRSSLSSPRISPPPFAFNHARILSPFLSTPPLLPRLIFAFLFSFFSGSNPIVKIYPFRSVSLFQLQRVYFSNLISFLILTAYNFSPHCRRSTRMDPFNRYFRWRIVRVLLQGQRYAQ